jgi:hypothetical protein
MITSRSLFVVALSASALVTSRARADEVSENFAAALKDSSGYYSSAWVITKMTTFKVGKKCGAKLADKNQGAIHAASFYTRDIAAYAKTVTNEDWSAIETQNNNDKEANKKLLEPIMDAFKSRFGVTVSIDGDDCDAKQSSLWLSYWNQIATTLKSYPPKAGKVFITLNVSSKFRDVTVDMAKDGSAATISAPKDIAAKDALEKIERPYRQLHSGITDDYAFKVKEATGDYYSAWILTKLTTFKIGKKCRAKLQDKDQGAIHAATFYTRDIAAYAKSVGADDWDEIEGQTANDPATNRAMVEKMIDAFKSRLSITVSVDGDDCDAKQGALWLKYWSEVATQLKNYPPRANKVVITINVTAKAKDVSIKAGKDGSTFAITAPRDKEPSAWTSKLEPAFSKAARKK